METDNIIETLVDELNKRDIKEDERKKIFKKLLETYATLLIESYNRAFQRSGERLPFVVKPEDVISASLNFPLAMKNAVVTEKCLEKAKRFLLDQGPNGVWGWWSWFDPPDLRHSIKKIWDTAISIKSLLRAGVSPKHHQIVVGVGWLLENNISDESPCWGRLPKIYKEKYKEEYLAPNTYETSCVLLALEEAKDVSSCDTRIIQRGIENLIRNQSVHGHWSAELTEGGKHHFFGAIGATSLALAAIARARNRGFVVAGMKESIGKAAEWLLRQQRKPKCFAWGEKEDILGNTAKTSDAIRALVESDYNRYKEAINNGVGWLLRNQGVFENGRGWGWRKTDRDQKLIASNVENTAFAVNALLKAKIRIDSIPIQTGLNWLSNHKKNGNWGADTPRVILTLSEYLKRLRDLDSSEKGREVKASVNP